MYKSARATQISLRVGYVHHREVWVLLDSRFLHAKSRVALEELKMLSVKDLQM